MFSFHDAQKGGYQIKILYSLMPAFKIFYCAGRYLDNKSEVSSWNFTPVPWWIQSNPVMSWCAIAGFQCACFWHSCVPSSCAYFVASLLCLSGILVCPLHCILVAFSRDPHAFLVASSLHPRCIFLASSRA